MTDSYVIDGGRRLEGEVSIGGAKNSALKLMATSLLAPGRSVLRRVPDISDVHCMVDVLRHLGVDVTWSAPGELTLDVPERLGVEAPYELVSRMRASIVVLGPLLARESRARVALPGGCNLGPRPVDLHLRGLEQLGAEIELVHGYLHAEAPRLVGAKVKLDYPSHGATENLVMAGALAEGTTIVENAARDPEILDLAAFLQSMGARIRGAGSSTIEIEGVASLQPATFEVMPDRLEAGTYMLAAAAAGGDVAIVDMVPEHLEIVIEKLQEAGVGIETGEGWARVRADGPPHAIDLSTLPYPGFPTDLYPLGVAFLTCAPGVSIVTENIFDGRFMFVDELARMGADIRVDGHYAVIKGAPALTGAPVRASDIRAGAALVIAGLAAEGQTVVEDIHFIDRGYESLEEKLRGLGAEIRRIRSGALVDA